MSGAEQATRSFCSALFARYDGDGGHQAVVASWPGPHITWVADPTPESVTAAVQAADARDRAEATYIAMTLLAPGTARSRTGRGGEQIPTRGSVSDVSVVLGVWADLDVAGDGHESGKRYPPDQESVRRVLAAAGLPPTIVVHSGHGLHAFWRFHEPIVFADEPDPEAARRAAAQLVRNWQLTLAVHAHRLGRWQFDSTADLARVLRPAGTWNRKIPGDHRPVRVLEIDETADVNPSDVEDFTLDAAELAEFAGMSDIPANAPVNKVNLTALWALCQSTEYRRRKYLPEWLAVMLEDQTISEGHRLLQVWDDGHPSGDSETDASLARHTAKLGLDARDAVEIIMCRRLRTGAKLEKVDPTQRGPYYLRRTVGRAFAEEEKQRAERAAAAEQGDELAAAVAAATGPAPAPQIAAPTPPSADVPPAVDRAGRAETGPRGLGGAIAADLDATVDQTRHDEPPPAAPPADPGFDDEFGGEFDPAVPLFGVLADPDDDPADEPADEPDAEPDAEHFAPDPDDDGVYDGPGPDPDPPLEELPPADAPDATAGAEQEPTAAPFAGPTPAPDDGPADPADPLTLPGTAASAAGGTGASDGASAGTGSGAPSIAAVTAGASSTWGSRTELQNKVLRALSVTLLGEQAEWVQIWRLQVRGRGAKAERRLVLRFRLGTRWAVVPPSGFVDGQPYATGWFPAAAFNTISGFSRALQQDAKLHVLNVKPEDFAKAFSRALVQMWEPDDSGGSLDNVTRAGLLSYLIDYPPVTEWNDAAQQGMPFIMQGSPRWSVDVDFTVSVRWADFGAHVRSQYGINTPPAVLADMAELAGARPVQTMTQDGRWRIVRRAYFTDSEWAAVLAQGQVAEQRRQDRHGMRLVGDDDGAERESPQDELGGGYRDEPGKRRPYEGWG